MTGQTAAVVDLAAARARREHRLATRRAMPLDPDTVLTDAARLLLAVEARAADVQRDARLALDQLREVHEFLMTTGPDETEAR